MSVILKRLFNVFITLKSTRLLFLTIIIAFVVNSDSYSQDSPIDVTFQGKRNEVGIMLGFGQNVQSGSYFVDCEGCEFMDGVRFGFTLGFFFEHYVNRSIVFGVMGIYDDLSINSSYVEIESINPVNTQLVNIPVSFRHESEFMLTNFALAPYFKWQPSEYFYIRTALSGGFVVNSSLDHRKTLLDKFVTLPNGEITEINISGTDEDTVVLQDGDIEGINTFQLGILPAIGLDLPLSDRATLGTSFQYYLPLTEVYSGADDFRINSWRMFIEFSYALTLQR